METKFDKFYKLLFHIQELVSTSKFEGKTDSIYVDLAVWNEYVTVKYFYSMFLVHSSRRMFVTESLFEAERTPGMMGVWSIDRVRGGYKISKIR